MKFSSELLKIIEVTCVTAFWELSVSGCPFTCVVCVNFMKLTCNGGDVPLCGATYFIFLKKLLDWSWRNLALVTYTADCRQPWCWFLLALYKKFIFYINNIRIRRSQWPRGLRRRSLAARLLRLWVRILLGAWMFVCCECCVLSGRGLCDGLIIRSEESYRLWRVVVCDQETS